MNKNTIGNINLPVSYSVDSFDNERFLKLRVKVMHTGLNLNNSVFGLEAVEAAKPTLANIPLLAFIKKVDGDDSQSDFAGHEYEIRITENDMKFVYLGRPIGIIPETNNYALETDEEGKIFVVVDAYVWKDYANSALDILNRDEVKKVSMEVIIDEYEWQSDYSYVDILAYKYTGVALLGEDVREAMIGAKAEVVKFSADSISTMMQELKTALAAFSAAEPEEEKEEEEVVENQMSANDSEDTTEEFTENEVDEPAAAEEPVEEMSAEPEIDEPTSTSTHRDFESEINALTEQINQLTLENNELKEYKANIEAEKLQLAKDALFAEFEDLDEEEIAPLKEQNFSLEDLEIRLFALRGKKVKVNTTPKLGIEPSLFSASKTKVEPEYAELIRKHVKN